MMHVERIIVAEINYFRPFMWENGSYRVDGSCSLVTRIHVRQVVFYFFTYLDSAYLMLKDNRHIPVMVTLPENALNIF